MLLKVSNSQLLLYLLLASIFLFKIPNFYVLPFTQNAFLTTQSIARILITVIFCFKTFPIILRGAQVFDRRESKVIALLLVLLFLIQSLSITQAVNYISFLNRYKDIILGVCSFFVFYYYKKEYKLLIMTIALSVIFNAFLQALLVFQPTMFLNIIGPFLYKNYATLLIANLDRGRFYLATYDEILIPFLFLPEIWKNIRFKYSQLFLFITIAFFALASNIRSNVLSLFVGGIGSFVAFRKFAFKKLTMYSLLLLILVFLVNGILLQFVGFSFYDRLTF